MNSAIADMQIHNVPVADIFSDPEFNIRGQIAPHDVIDLARNIETNGLLQPITIQPYFNEPGYKWRVIAGHRRFTAYQIMGWPTIPAIIKEGLSDIELFTLNFIENVDRQDLNILQEAKGLAKFKEAGFTIQQTAKKINKGTGWINIRFKLLELPVEIQAAAAAGILTQSQILDVASLPTSDQQYEAVRLIKEHRQSGEKVALKVRPKKVDPTKRRRRTDQEIGSMLGIIYDQLGPNILTRVLAWVKGDISDLDLFKDLIEYSEEIGKKFELPPEIKEFMKDHEMPDLRSSPMQYPSIGESGGVPTSVP